MKDESEVLRDHTEEAKPFGQLAVGDFMRMRTTDGRQIVVRKIAPVPRELVAENSHAYGIRGQIDEPRMYNVIRLDGKICYYDYFCLPSDLVVNHIPKYL